jgi:hypothetical protein
VEYFYWHQNLKKDGGRWLPNTGPKGADGKHYRVDHPSPLLAGIECIVNRGSVFNHLNDYKGWAEVAQRVCFLLWYVYPVMHLQDIPLTTTGTECSAGA